MVDASARDRRAPFHGRAPHEGRHRLGRTDRPAGLGASEIADAPIHATGLIAADEPAPERTGRLGKAMLSFARDLVIVAVLAIVMSMLIKTFLLRPFYIPSASMNDTLVVEDRVLVNLLVPDMIGIERGDIVVFEDPGGWLPVVAPTEKTASQAAVDGALEFVGLKPEETSNHLIKRVIGLPGDTVSCCNEYGQVLINGLPIGEPYLLLQDGQAASGLPFDVTVPEGHLWVMGDNRYNSEDSRYHQDEPGGGFVPVDDVVGKAFLLNWPLDRFTFLGNYPEVFDRVPERTDQE
ncbi:signal peptidase I [Pseudoclavibacter sp. VKM Ac-2888]|uniref:signal peptidase I n=1 Tax=Pseudoclavibacter sp. VKM Ac-2888 TaxID=2783830 RepID=UPI001E5EA3F9|nr:signal peptidase I [Pseudoclavibacter sp. VKM Ac-2888]